MRPRLLVGTLALLLACGLVCSSAVAELNWTPCEQWQLEGTWDVFIATDGVNCPGEAAKTCQQLQVDANGWILNSPVLESQCGEEVITGGQLLFTPSCVVEGYIETASGIINVERGGDNGDGSLILDSDLE